MCVAVHAASWIKVVRCCVAYGLVSSLFCNFKEWVVYDASIWWSSQLLTIGE